MTRILAQALARIASHLMETYVDPRVCWFSNATDDKEEAR
jgi:hypothetical protein